jgi:hypothetical protein
VRLHRSTGGFARGFHRRRARARTLAAATAGA